MALALPGLARGIAGAFPKREKGIEEELAGADHLPLAATGWLDVLRTSSSRSTTLIASAR
jgi:hypothetical protein